MLAKFMAQCEVASSNKKHEEDEMQVHRTIMNQIIQLLSPKSSSRHCW